MIRAQATLVVSEIGVNSVLTHESTLSQILTVLFDVTTDFLLACMRVNKPLCWLVSSWLVYLSVAEDSDLFYSNFSHWQQLILFTSNLRECFAINLNFPQFDPEVAYKNLPLSIAHFFLVFIKASTASKRLMSPALRLNPHPHGI